VNDPFLVRGVERIGNLPGDCERLGDRERAARQPIGKGVPLHQLQHQRPKALGFLDAVDCADMRMVQRGEHSRFPLETRQTFRIGAEDARQDFDRDIAPEPRVARAIHLPHPARPEQPLQLKRANSSAGQHGRTGIRDHLRGDRHGAVAEEALAGRRLREQQLHLAPQLRVSGAGGLEKGGALAGAPLSRGMVERLDA
jgi:hypothetical protein